MSERTKCIEMERRGGSHEFKIWVHILFDRQNAILTWNATVCLTVLVISFRSINYMCKWVGKAYSILHFPKTIAQSNEWNSCLQHIVIITFKTKRNFRFLLSFGRFAFPLHKIVHKETKSFWSGKEKCLLF